MSFITLLMLRSSKKTILIMVWLSIGLTIIVIEIIGYLLYLEYRRAITNRCLFGEDRHGCGGLSSKIFFYSGVVFWVVGAIYMVWMAKLFNDINLGIGIMAAALPITRRFSQMKRYPNYPAIFIIILGFGFVSIVFNCFSISNRKIIDAKQIDGGKVVKYIPDYFMAYFLPADFFILYFFSILSYTWAQFMSSYAFTIWFFTKKNETVSMDPERCFADSFKYHFGFFVYQTLVSILMKPFAFITLVITGAFERLSQRNIIVRMCMGACVFCLCFHQIYFRFLSKTALIQLDMWSEPYITSARKSYFLRTVRHGNRGVGKDKLVEFTLRQMKYSISLIGGMITILYCMYMPYTPLLRTLKHLESNFTGSIFVFLLSYFISTIYMEYYDMSIKAIVQCRLMDEEMHVGDQRFSTHYTDELMGFWRKKDIEEGYNMDAKVRNKDAGEDVRFDDGLYGAPKEEAEQSLIYGDDSDDSGSSDEFAEKKKVKINKEQDFILSEEEIAKKKILAEAEARKKEIMEKKKAEQKQMYQEQLRKRTQKIKVQTKIELQPIKKDKQVNDENLEMLVDAEAPIKQPAALLINPNLKKIPKFDDIDDLGKSDVRTKSISRVTFDAINEKEKSTGNSNNPSIPNIVKQTNSNTLLIPGQSQHTKALSINKSSKSKKSKRSRSRHNEDDDEFGDKKSHHRSKKSKSKHGLDEDEFGDKKSHHRSKKSKSKHEDQVDDFTSKLQKSKQSPHKSKDPEIEFSHAPSKSKKEKKSKHGGDDFDDRRSRKHNKNKKEKVDNFFDDLEDIADNKGNESVQFMNASNMNSKSKIGTQKDKSIRVGGIQFSDDEDDKNNFF